MWYCHGHVHELSVWVQWCGGHHHQHHTRAFKFIHIPVSCYLHFIHFLAKFYENANICHHLNVFFFCVCLERPQFGATIVAVFCWDFPWYFICLFVVAYFYDVDQKTTTILAYTQRWKCKHELYHMRNTIKHAVNNCKMCSVAHTMNIFGKK